jgi:hypothetical protein
MASLRVLFVVNCVYVGVWVVVLSVSDHDDRSITKTVIVGLFVASSITGMGILIRRGDQRVAGTRDHDDWAVVVRALWTGDAPADTSFDEGLQILAAKRFVDVRRMPWVLSTVTALALVVTISWPGPGSIALTCGSGLVSLFLWRERAQRSPRLVRLAETLRSRSAC